MRLLKYLIKNLLTRIGLLKACRKGSAWIVHIDNIKQYQSCYLNKMISNIDEDVS